MDRQRVEQLIGDECAFERFRQRRPGRREAVDDIVQRACLRLPGLGARLDEVESNGVVEGGMSSACGAGDIAGETSVPGAGFDEVEILAAGSGTQNSRHLVQLYFQQLPEQRPDIHAGKKIARAARALGGAGVVTEVDRRARDLNAATVIGPRSRSDLKSEI
jgi:hypothetical protein